MARFKTVFIALEKGHRFATLGEAIEVQCNSAIWLVAESKAKITSLLKWPSILNKHERTLTHKSIFFLAEGPFDRSPIICTNYKVGFSKIPPIIALIECHDLRLSEPAHYHCRLAHRQS